MKSCQPIGAASMTEPPDASPSSRNRIADCPILISSVGLVTMRTPTLLGASADMFATYSSAIGLPVLATLGLSVNILASDAPFFAGWHHGSG